MTTIKDVAREAGVSTATVSRVLSGTDHVSEGVCQKVLETVKKLDYRPNRVARSLRVSKSSIIGLIVADIENTYFTAVSRAVQDRAYEAGYNVFLCNTDERADKEEEYLQFMMDENVAGIIISPTHLDEKSGEKLINLRIPSILLDRELPSLDLDTVIIDNQEAAFRLTEHLIQNGRKKIAIIAGSGSTTGKNRIKGYREALEQGGIPFEQNLVVETEATESSGYQAMSQILTWKTVPDAVLSTNGLLANGVFSKLKEAKIEIPRDMAFCTFDETRWTSLVSPPVTVIRQPTLEIGRQAVDLLLSRIEGGEDIPRRKIVLGTDLIVRESTLGTS